MRAARFAPTCKGAQHTTATFALVAYQFAEYDKARSISTTEEEKQSQDKCAILHSIPDLKTFPLHSREMVKSWIEKGFDKFWLFGASNDCGR